RPGLPRAASARRDSPLTFFNSRKGGGGVTSVNFMSIGAAGMGNFEGAGQEQGRRILAQPLWSAEYLIGRVRPPHLSARQR
ncbi:MAG: hypothetical protein WCD27_15150, partial [Candidatus Acidiferrales bacterium]